MPSIVDLFRNMMEMRMMILDLTLRKRGQFEKQNKQQPPGSKWTHDTMLEEEGRRVLVFDHCR
jgi:hypothetical protein